MGALRVGLGLTAWREAWLARRDNPLPRLWRLGQARAEQRRAWWRHAPGLTLLGVGVSAAVTYLLLLIIRQFLALHQSALATHSYALGLLRAGTLVLACGAMLLGGCWLLMRLYACAHLALSLLGRTRRKGSAVLDDALLASALSNEQVVLGLVLHAWRMLLPPALVLNIANAVVYFVWNAWPTGGDELWRGDRPIPWTPEPWNSALSTALAFLLFQMLAAMVGVTLLMLLLLMLGRGVGPLAPATGAATLIMLQLGLVTAVSDYRFPLSEIANYPNLTMSSLWYVLALGLLILFYWLAHRSYILRNLCAHSLLIYAALLTGLFVWSSLTGVKHPEFSDFIVSITGWLAVSLSLLPAGESCLSLASAGVSVWLPTLALFGTAITLLQLMLCLPLAQLARDAVRLHRGGAG
jgi:hypothetical protein